MTIVMALLLSSGFFSLADWSSIVHRALGLSAFLQVNKKRWTKANQSGSKFDVSRKEEQEAKLRKDLSM